MKLLRTRLCAAFFAPLLLLAPALAQAHGSSHAGMSCAGHESSSSFIVVSMQCTGDFALSGGNFSSPLGVIVRSGGDLTLTGVSVQAPFVEFISQGALSFGGGGKLDGNTWSILDGRLGAVGSHTTQPVVIKSGSEVFTGLPSHPLATASTLSWEIFSTGTDCGPFFDLPGHAALDLRAGADLIGLYFGALALAADLTSGTGSIFVEIAGHGGALITLSPVVPVPEPGTWALLLAGLGALVVMARARRA